MLGYLRQCRRTIAACVLPVLLLAWLAAAAGVCPHGHGERHDAGHAHESHGAEHHSDHEAAGKVAEHDNCERGICPHCTGGPRAGSDAVLSFCAACVADGAVPTGPGHQVQMDPDQPSAQPVLFVADVRTKSRARGQPPPDPATMPQPVPINLRHCVFLN